MATAFRSFICSGLWRAISIACVMVAFSYIFFEVLDLGGSTFPLRQYPIENTAIVPEVETNIVRPYLTRLALPWTEISFFFLPEQADRVRPHLTENVKASAFNFLQRRNYRVALPRSSVPDHLSSTH
jgi:hypothetical protein